MLGEPLRRGLSARGPEDYTLSQDAPSAGRPTSTQQTSQHTSDDMLALVLNSLDDDKAEEVVTIDLRGRTAIADHMVIASGPVFSRPTAAMSIRMRADQSCG